MHAVLKHCSSNFHHIIRTNEMEKVLIDFRCDKYREKTEHSMFLKSKELCERDFFSLAMIDESEKNVSILERDSRCGTNEK